MHGTPPNHAPTQILNRPLSGPAVKGLWLLTPNIHVKEWRT